jgi:transposase
MTQVTVLTGVRRRRDWTDQDRLEILREAFSPGACVADVARRHDVSRGLIYLWRRAALRQVQETFVPAVIEDEPGTTANASWKSRKPRLCWTSPMADDCGFSPRPRPRLLGCLEGDAMIPAGARVWIAMGHTDMRRGMQSLAAMVQQHFTKDPFGGDLWVFRGRSGSLVKIIWHDGIGMSLYAKRLEKVGLCGRRRRTGRSR